MPSRHLHQVVHQRSDAALELGSERNGLPADQRDPQGREGVAERLQSAASPLGRRYRRGNRHDLSFELS